MKNLDRIQALQEAQDLLFEAIEKIEWAVNGTEDEKHYDSYLISSLKIITSKNSGYCTSAMNIEDIMSDLAHELL
tara:strand:- start:1633 stop:1857 length:225 start_codon:yes stop_codon:yes gene_type:complete